MEILLLSKYFNAYPTTVGFICSNSTRALKIFTETRGLFFHLIIYLEKKIFYQLNTERECYLLIKLRELGLKQTLE